jgi:hypothetical protein
LSAATVNDRISQPINFRRGIASKAKPNLPKRDGLEQGRPTVVGDAVGQASALVQSPYFRIEIDNVNQMEKEIPLLPQYLTGIQTRLARLSGSFFFPGDSGESIPIRSLSDSSSYLEPLLQLTPDRVLNGFTPSNYGLIAADPTLIFKAAVKIVDTIESGSLARTRVGLTLNAYDALGKNYGTFTVEPSTRDLFSPTEQISGDFQVNAVFINQTSAESVFSQTFGQDRTIYLDGNVTVEYLDDVSRFSNIPDSSYAYFKIIKEFRSIPIILLGPGEDRRFSAMYILNETVSRFATSIQVQLQVFPSLNGPTPANESVIYVSGSITADRFQRTVDFVNTTIVVPLGFMYPGNVTAVIALDPARAESFFSLGSPTFSIQLSASLANPNGSFPTRPEVLNRQLSLPVTPFTVVRYPDSNRTLATTQTRGVLIDLAKSFVKTETGSFKSEPVCVVQCLADPKASQANTSKYERT